jgi:hypothetical protein
LPRLYYFGRGDLAFECRQSSLNFVSPAFIAIFVVQAKGSFADRLPLWEGVKEFDFSAVVVLVFLRSKNQ